MMMAMVVTVLVTDDGSASSACADGTIFCVALIKRHKLRDARGFLFF